VENIVLYGAIELDKFLEVCPVERKQDEPLVVVRHSVSDYRKHVTEQSVNGGDKIHVWQKNLMKEKDTKFYARLVNDLKNVRFEFMEAHEELVKEFAGDKHFVFHKWNSMPVTEFLRRGHVFLYRCSNSWRNQFPRNLGEALASGLPAIVEPRDGDKDRVIYGNSGYYATDFDGFLYALKLMQRKDEYRKKMGMFAKDWARQNLDPNKWVSIIEEIDGR
jgi:glycosyltransferase involved in cell wall biosynthesis